MPFLLQHDAEGTANLLATMDADGSVGTNAAALIISADEVSTSQMLLSTETATSLLMTAAAYDLPGQQPDCQLHPITVMNSSNKLKKGSANKTSNDFGKALLMYNCEPCGKNFGSQKAKSQHDRLVHHSTKVSYTGKLKRSSTL